MQKSFHQDLPGDAVDGNLPANAGDMGLIPGLGRFQMTQNNKVCSPQLLSLHATTTETCVPGACAPHQEKLWQ